MKISNNSVVTMHFTVSAEDGTQIDSSRKGEPMVVLQGSHYLIQGLEDALEGKASGDKFELSVGPELAYGERHDNLVQAVPKNMFDNMDIEAGMQFRATTDDGEQSVIVLDVTDDEVVIDGNHPLSGLTLDFEVEIIDVRAATEDELAHGHAHAPGGCGHQH
ncbi:peptidylprolyl isomerase [Alteromonadaceae bacterium BrNp21-10]|nr:peptidylprolyl isomerase [Alteromonadaceae bacterium BrNp21-10]